MIPTHLDEIVDAARGDLPARYVQPLAVSVAPSGDAAVVLLDTNSGPNSDPYSYEVHCFQDEMGSHDGSSSNGWGWNRNGGGIQTFFLFAPWQVTANEFEALQRVVVLRHIFGDNLNSDSID